jgi:predicted ribonuclease YlaK
MAYLLALDELDKWKKGKDEINLKTREAIRYLDRQIKERPSKSLTATNLRMQSPEEMFPKWADCTGRRTRSDTDALKDISRLHQGIINYILYQRSRGNDYSIITESADLISFAKDWNIATVTVQELDSSVTQSMEQYNEELKKLEMQNHNLARSRRPKSSKLWTPSK